MFVSQIFDEAAEILATTDQSKIFRKLTQAVQTLMESGHYFHTNAEVDVCTGWDGQTITLPRGIEVPLGVNVDGSPTYFRGRLFQYHVNKGGMYNPVNWAWDDRGFVSTIMDIRQPSQLIAVAEHAADAGLTIRVVGTDSNNRDLRTQTADGVGIDGMIIPIHAQSDYPYGSIVPDGVTLQTRSAAVTPLTQFVSTPIHQLVSGQAMVLSLGSGVMPTALIAGKTYYIGVDDANTIQLYESSLDAKAKINPIALQSIIDSGTITLTDSRPTNLLTGVNLQSSPGVAIDSPNEVTFSTSTDAGFSGVLPSPLRSDVTYFAQPQDSTNLLIYESLNDAQNATNPVLMTGNSGKFNVDIRKPIAPYTTLKFSVKHYYTTGDEVQAFTSSGTLPTPLIANQNYFVNVIDDYTLTLHSNYTDAQNGNNPIILTGSGSGTNSLVKLLPATVTTGTSSQITAPGLNLQTPTGAGANATAYPVGGVVSVNLTSPGQSYTNAPTVTFDAPPTPPVGESYPISTAKGYAVMVLDSTNSQTYKIGSIVITDPGAGYVSAPSISIQAPQLVVNFSTNASSSTNTITTASSAASNLIVGLQVTGTGVPANTFISSISGPSSGVYTIVLTNAVSVSNGAALTAVPPVGSRATASCTIQTSSIGYIELGNAGGDYENPPIVTITGGNGSGAVAVADIDGSGHVSAIRMIARGTGYTTTPSVGITASTGVFVEFTSTGSMPNPLISGTAYRAESPFNSSTGTFTVKNSDYSDIDVTSAPTGDFYVALTRSFSVGFNQNWNGDFNGVNNGQLIYLASDYQLPNPLSASTAYYLGKITSNTAKIFKDAGHSVNYIRSYPSNVVTVLQSSHGFSTGDFVFVSSATAALGSADGVNGQFQITKVDGNTYTYVSTSNLDGTGTATVNRIASISSLGSGQSYFAIRVPAYAQALNNQLVPSSIEYLQNGELVQFSSTGSLPAPLSNSVNYKIAISGNNITLQDINNAPIVFVDSGKPTLAIGQMSMNIARTFQPIASTSLVSDNYLYETGDQITVRPNTGDSLPSTLFENSFSTPHLYYIRRVDGIHFELYDTKAHAINLSATTGRISYYNTGNSVDSTFFVDAILPPTLVKGILHIEKPITQGYVSLYAYDYGRSNDMCLIGQYHPSETNPKYRRIRIGQQCSWARIIYRVKAPVITSSYDYIPLENERAIIAAVHACDLEDKDFHEQAQKYWASAFGYLRNQNESMEGHAMQPPAINNLTYGDGSDDVLF